MGRNGDKQHAFDAGSMTGQIKALQASFNTLSLGGITVTDNSDGFSVSKSNGSNRTVNLRDGGEGYTLFDIGGDFLWELPAKYGTELFSTPTPCLKLPPARP